MSDVTRLLHAIEDGDRLATRELLPLVYDELKRIAAAKMANEANSQTLQTTALVHEAFLRLVGDEAPQWDTRGHFFAAAAEAMRRILIERARSRGRLKRGGDWNRIELESIEDPFVEPDVDIEALDEALQQLEREQPEKAALVKLRFFAGLSVEDAAHALGISTATAGRNWRYARAWLAEKLTADDSPWETPAGSA